ncbi:hypothetical protein LTR70_004537 [Exophiala xenobiotica]|uniref:Uncharacterized protein n=1 Tax=Lithohypha guttulata TaxID=1690604 RepID=A0ABR0KP57_9EURO|nr:hypothetical protein LTR24_000467 [Lithohypha guttulata]KAK5320454.1 hypothetical protein LTR70_004537 [Exophiala xenobiotica]
MAAPREVTIKKLSGKFVMNKSLSDDTNNLLALQGISWLTRKAIALATVVLTIKEYTDDKGAVHIDITSNASGLSSTQEDRILDWADRPHKDKIFGNVAGRTRMIDLSTGTFEPCVSYSEAELQFLQAKYLKDGKTPSKFEDNKELVQSYVKNQDSGYGWTAEQLWGFEVVNGKRYYTRRVVVKNAKGDKSERVRLVYDYQGPAGKASNDDDGLAYAYGEGEGDEKDSDTEVEAVVERGVVLMSEDNGDERHIDLTEAEHSSHTEQDDSGIAKRGISEEVGTTKDVADLGIVAGEVGAETKSDDDDHGTITDDYEADSEEPVTAFDNRRYSEVTGGMSEMSLTDAIICVGFGYALVYA